MLSLTTSSTGVRPSPRACSTAVASRVLPDAPAGGGRVDEEHADTAARADAGSPVPAPHPSASQPGATSVSGDVPDDGAIAVGSTATQAASSVRRAMNSSAGKGSGQRTG